MKEYILFFTDKRFLSALLILFCFEICLQVGAYKPFLKKNSYAANVNRIANHAIQMKQVLDPDIIIIGTSVAFEGLSVRIMNEVLQETGLKVQTLAIPGSELIVQDQVIESYLNQFPNVKLILHIMEPGMPWVDRDALVLPTLAMLSELGNFHAISTINEFEYNATWQDYAYLLLKSIAYRRDMQDFLSEPQERIKFLGREWREPNTEQWDYDNPHLESIAPYNVGSIQECIDKTNPGNTDPIPKGSSERHKKMLYDTCALSLDTPNEAGSTPATERYFRRLEKIYQKIDSNSIHLIHVFAPYSEIIKHFGGERRMPLWQSELDRVTQATLGYNNADIINLENILDGRDNNKYCFDLIHLNRPGMEIFSHKLATILKKRYNEGSLFPKKNQ